MLKNTRYTVASFFSGCGGFDYGFDKNKFSILFGNDLWKGAAETFKVNYPKVPFFEKPIQEITSKEIKNVVKSMRADVLIGGPPCQCFTRLNNNHLIKLTELKKEDDRRTLSQEYIKKVKLLKPKIVLMENVKDLLFRKNQEGILYSDIIKDAFREIGYETYYKIISMEKYGVPQKRKRVIFLATNVKKLIKKLNENPDFGFPEESKRVISVSEALSVIENKEGLQNHTFTINEPETLKRIKCIPQGGYYEDLPERLKTKKIRNGKEVVVKRYGSYLRRLHPDKPSTTITNNYIIHPTKDRYLSNRELATLHSFPKDYKFKGCLGSVSQQIANAVPPKFAKKMAKKVRALLDEYCD